jgi:serine/threonine protein kinase
LQERDLQRFRTATALARKLGHHSNIADMVAASETETTISVTFCLGGEPVDLFFPSRRSSFFTMKERMAACVTAQLLSLLAFLHAKGIDAGSLNGGLYFEDLILLSVDGGFRVKIIPTVLHGGSLEHAFDMSKTP